MFLFESKELCISIGGDATGNVGIPIHSLWEIFKQSMWSLAHLPLQIPQADSGDQKTSWVPRAGAGKNKVEGCPDDHCSHLGTEMHLCLCPRLVGSLM